ncbi:MAG TPA: cobaltochelatase subunit CobN, partial [Nocardioides sp.]|nr:cobaltochelatase subunit CobN [Nocardioides sp.]
MTRIALLSTSDTDLLSARSSGADYVWANPARSSDADLTALVDGAAVVVIRLLGSPDALWSGVAGLREAGTPLVILGGEQTPSAELMELSTVPIGIAAQAHAYLAEGGPTNLGHLHAFLTDSILLTGEGFEPPSEIPAWGWASRSTPADGKARVGVLYYRAHEASGNTRFAHDLADAIDATGHAVGLPIFAGSLRAASDDLYEALGTLDALVVTVLAAGGSVPAAASAGEDDESWDVERMAALDIPVLQGLCLTSSRAEWEASDDGVTPLDYATQIAIPEFDGRISTAPFSFKELDDQGLPHYVSDPERCARVAGIAVNHARLRHLPNAEKKLALVLSAYPTKHARIGNAVGLDTPVSAIRMLRRLREEGYDLGSENAVLPLLDLEDDTEAGDAL